MVLSIQLIVSLDHKYVVAIAYRTFFEKLISEQKSKREWSHIMHKMGVGNSEEGGGGQCGGGGQTESLLPLYKKVIYTDQRAPLWVVSIHRTTHSGRNAN